MNIQPVINTPFNTRFARLFPADRPAHLAFDRIASKLKAEPGWNQHARKYMVVFNEKIDIDYMTKEKQSESESEGGSGPQLQKRSIWRGLYQLDLSLPPRNPHQGWMLGGGKFAPGDESPELVLTERKAQDFVHGRHARLSHNYSSGALLLHVADKSLATVDGKEVRDSIVIWSSETLVTFGTLNYRLQLDGAVDGIHRHRLKFYQQIHGLGTHDYPVALLSTPAKSDYIHKDYVVKNPIGHGCSSTVFAAMNVKTSAVVAIKRIVRHHCNAGQIEREIEMATILGRHSRLCQLVDTMSPEGEHRSTNNLSDAFDEVYLVYSPLAHTSWVHLITPGPPNELHNTFCTTIFWQCLEGIEYIHSKGVMHRDIKPENLAIISFDPPQSRVIDFGNAIRTVSSNEVTTGTPKYLAPEVWRIVRNEAVSGLKVYDNKLDMFAFGVSAYQIFCKRSAYWEEADDETVANMKAEIRGQKGASTHVKKLIRSMLVDDADLRPSAGDLFTFF